MATSNKTNVTLRSDKASPLTREELDGNFSELENVIDDATNNEQGLENHENAADPHPQYVLEDELGSNSVSTSTGDQTLVDALDQRGPVFDTVADLDAAQDLTIGIKCRTLGYYSPGDGGGNDYEIVEAATGTEDGGSFIDLSGSGLQAKGLFVGGRRNVEQWGAKEGDSGSVDAAFANIPEGDYHIVSNLSSALDITLSGEYSLATEKGASLTINGGAGILAMYGDKPKVHSISLVGRLFIGRELSTDTPSTGVYIGDVDITSLAADNALSLRICDNPSVGTVRLHLNRDGTGNRGFSFYLVRNPNIDAIYVDGKVSNGIEVIGSGTDTTRPSMEGGRIGTIRVEQEAGYTADSGDHGCYFKTAVGVQVDKIHVTGDGWASPQNHIKFREDRYCQFNELIAEKHDGSNGFIICTSDGTDNATVDGTFENIFRNVRGRFAFFETSPGDTRNCTLENFTGEIDVNSIKSIFLTGRIVLQNDGDDLQFAGTFINAHVIIQNMSASGSLAFSRDLLSIMSQLDGDIVIRNRSSTIIGGRISGDISHLRTAAGTDTSRIRNCVIEGSLVTSGFSDRNLDAIFTHVHLFGNEPTGANEPTNKFYRFVSYGDVTYITESQTAA